MLLEATFLLQSGAETRIPHLHYDGTAGFATDKHLVGFLDPTTCKHLVDWSKY